MKLKDPRTSPSGGGFFFICADGHRVTGTNLRALNQLVDFYLRANDLLIPNDLGQQIEDQICSRLPASNCWQGAGDWAAKVIQAGAGAVDFVMGTQLKAAAKACGSCGSRRRKLNRLVN